MAIFRDVVGWMLIAAAAVNAARVRGELAAARRSGEGPGVIAARACSGVCLTVVFLAEGVVSLRNAYPAWSAWTVTAFGACALIALAVPGIAARGKAGVPWWRFGARVVPPPAAGVTGPADALEPGPAVVLDAGALDLIGKITNARFGTVRLSRGYDEEDVDSFLDRLTAALGEGGRLNQAELLNPRFSTTRLRPGYAMGDVDGLLGEIAGAVPS